MSAPCAESLPIEYDKPGSTLCFRRLTITSTSDRCGWPTLKLDNIRCAIATSKSVAAVQATVGRSSQSKTISTRLHLGQLSVGLPTLLGPAYSEGIQPGWQVHRRDHAYVARDARIWRVVCEDDKTT